MPHISIKMLEGRSDYQKKLAVEKVSNALKEALGCDEKHISVSVEDFSAVEWQDVFAIEIEGNENVLKKPAYDPKSLL